MTTTRAGLPCGSERDLHRALAEAEDSLADFARTTAMHWKEIRFLTDLAELLHPGLGAAESAQLVASRSAQLMGAACSAVYLRGEGGRLVPVVRVESQGDRAREELATVSRALAERVVDLGEAVLADSPGELTSDLGCGTAQGPMIGAPVGVQGDFRGALVLLGRRVGARFGTEEARLLMAAATQLGVALRNTRMTAALAEAERVAGELERAREIQRRLLPSPPYQVEGFDVAAAYEPAESVGGDYFDIVATEGGGFAVCIADVSGHGVPAALFMSGVRSAARTLLSSVARPDAVARALNRHVWEDAGDSGVFVTAIVGRYDVPSSEMILVNCGHPAPLLVDTDGRWRGLDGATLPLGVLPSLDCEEVRVRIAPGDLLAFCSDGVLEAARSSGAAFGVAGLSGAVAARRSGPLSEAAAAIAAEVLGFTGAPRLQDDLTLLLLRRHAVAGGGA